MIGCHRCGAPYYALCTCVSHHGTLVLDSRLTTGAATTFPGIATTTISEELRQQMVAAKNETMMQMVHGFGLANQSTSPSGNKKLLLLRRNQ